MISRPERFARIAYGNSFRGVQTVRVGEVVG